MGQCLHLAASFVRLAALLSYNTTRAPLIQIGMHKEPRFDLTDVPSYLFTVPLPEVEAARLLSWKPTLVSG